MAEKREADCPVHGPRGIDGHGGGYCNAIVGRVTEGRFTGWPLLCGKPVKLVELGRDRRAL